MCKPKQLTESNAEKEVEFREEKKDLSYLTGVNHLIKIHIIQCIKTVSRQVVNPNEQMVLRRASLPLLKKKKKKSSKFWPLTFVQVFVKCN